MPTHAQAELLIEITLLVAHAALIHVAKSVNEWLTGPDSKSGGGVGATTHVNSSETPRSPR
jgi:hypothetical protein